MKTTIRIIIVAALFFMNNLYAQDVTTVEAMDSQACNQTGSQSYC